MSLILEALKKSESQRRLGQAPDIGTPFSATRRRASPLPWLLGIAIVIAALVGWWTLRSPSAPEPDTTAASNVAGGKTVSAGKKAIAAQRAAENAASRAAQTATHAPVKTVATPAPPPAAATSPVTAPTTPTTMPAATAATNTVHTPSPAAAPNATSPPPVATPATPTPPPAAAVPAPASAAPTQTAVAAKTPPASASNDVQSVDDLPYAIRKDLPDLPISMQVYSADPARRFVVISGDRKVEGEAVAGGVTLREVRANGIVLEYQGQRFFLPRPGS